MTLYVDTSALMKRYIEEPDSDLAAEMMLSDPVLVTSRLTEIELRRNLTRLLSGKVLLGVRRRVQADLYSLLWLISMPELVMRRRGSPSKPCAAPLTLCTLRRRCAAVTQPLF